VAKAYTTFQAAKILGVSPPTVIKWANDGIINSYRTPGGHRRILASEIQRFLAKHNLPEKQKKSTELPEKIALFISDEAYSQLILEFLDHEHVLKADDPFHLGWILGKNHIRYLIWDWYEEPKNALFLLSRIRAEVQLQHTIIIGLLPLYEQLSSSFSPYFSHCTPKNQALSNLGKWIV